MNSAKVIEVAETYLALFAEKKTVPKCFDSDAYFPSYEQKLSHLAWMCSEIKKFAETKQQKELEKAFRWLGFVQGVLWDLQWRSIGAMRTDNR